MRLAIPALVLLYALAPESSQAAERSFTVSSFDRVRLDGPFNVILTTGVAPFARASGSQQGLDSIALDIVGRTLVIHPNRSSWGGYPGQPLGPVTIEVGTHDLSAAWLNGSGSLAIDKAKGLSFDLSVQGAGSASIGSVAVDHFKVAISGTGTASVAGTAPKLTAIVRGISSLDASGLGSKDAIIGAQGPATVRANVSNTAKIDAQGAATIELSGRPACTVKAVGSATVSGCR